MELIWWNINYFNWIFTFFWMLTLVIRKIRSFHWYNIFYFLGKQRFAHAAAFFLLSGSLKDALDICIDKLDDLQLAMVISRYFYRVEKCYKKSLRFDNFFHVYWIRGLQKYVCKKLKFTIELPARQQSESSPSGSTFFDLKKPSLELNFLHISWKMFLNV